MRVLALRFVLNGVLLLLATLLEGVWVDSLRDLLLPTILLVLTNGLLPLLLVLLGLPVKPAIIGVSALVLNLLLLVLFDWLIGPFHAQGVFAVTLTTVVVAGANYTVSWLAYRRPAAVGS